MSNATDGPISCHNLTTYAHRWPETWGFAGTLAVAGGLFFALCGRRAFAATALLTTFLAGFVVAATAAVLALGPAQPVNCVLVGVVVGTASTFVLNCFARAGQCAVAGVGGAAAALRVWGLFPMVPAAGLALVAAAAAACACAALRRSESALVLASTSTYGAALVAAGGQCLWAAYGGGTLCPSPWATAAFVAAALLAALLQARCCGRRREDRLRGGGRREGRRPGDDDPAPAYHLLVGGGAL